MLSDVDRRRHARQILLPELGFAGQERLGASKPAWHSEFDPRSRAVAADYLARAGLRCEPLESLSERQPLAAASEPELAADEVAPLLVRRADVERWAGEPALEDCAAWLLGALSAVEAIKQAIGAGEPSSLAALGSSWREQR